MYLVTSVKKNIITLSWIHEISDSLCIMSLRLNIITNNKFNCELPIYQCVYILSNEILKENRFSCMRLLALL